MGARGKKSSAAQGAPIVAIIDSSWQRLRPPADLPPEAKAVFESITGHCDARHFREAEKPLLLAYVRALLIERHFGNQITGDKVDIGFNQWERSVKVCATLARALRLCPSTRYDARQAQRQGPPGGGCAAPWDFVGEKDGDEE